MEEQFWQDKWKSNQIPFHNADVHPLLTKNLSAFGLNAGARVFVPLCGKSVDMRWLASQRFEVIGAELSEIAVQQFFSELGIEPHIKRTGALQRYEGRGVTILQGNIFDVTPEILGPVDLVYDRAALVALPPEMRAKYVPHMLSLTVSAPQFLICFEYDQTKLDPPPFATTEEDLRSIYPQEYMLQMLERKEVPGGLRGVCPAVEAAWNIRKAI